MDTLIPLPGVSEERVGYYLIVLTVVLPYLLAVVQQRSWSKKVRQGVTLAVCLLAAVAVLLFEGQLDPANALGSAALLFALTASFYKRFAKTRGAAKIEDVSTAILKLFAGTARRDSKRAASKRTDLTKGVKPDGS